MSRVTGGQGQAEPKQKSFFGRFTNPFRARRSNLADREGEGTREGVRADLGHSTGNGADLGNIGEGAGNVGAYLGHSNGNAADLGNIGEGEGGTGADMGNFGEGESANMAEADLGHAVGNGDGVPIGQNLNVVLQTLSTSTQTKIEYSDVSDSEIDRDEQMVAETKLNLDILFKKFLNRNLNVAILEQDVHLLQIKTGDVETELAINTSLRAEIKRLTKSNKFYKDVILAQGALNLGQSGSKGKKTHSYQYPDMKMKKLIGNFKMEIKGGQFTDSEIIVLLGENGTGKTTFVRMLAGLEHPDGEEGLDLNVSYKPQKMNERSYLENETVRKIIRSKIVLSSNEKFNAEVIVPLKLDQIFIKSFKSLAKDELQRLYLALCLATPADVYLIDEPFNYLDSEQRLAAAKVIKRFILHTKKTGFVVEQDFIMATYADRVMVFERRPDTEPLANAPQEKYSGIWKFLAVLANTDAE